MKRKVPQVYSSPTCDQRMNAALRIAWTLEVIPVKASRANIGIRDLIVRMLNLNPADRPYAFGMVTELLALDTERYFCVSCQQYIPHIRIRDWKEKYVVPSYLMSPSSWFYVYNSLRTYFHRSRARLLEGEPKTHTSPSRGGTREAEFDSVG